MCLVIDPIKHNKNKEGCYEPLIAKEDIVAYKQLLPITSRIWVTPFQRQKIVFKNGICIQETDSFGYNAYVEKDSSIKDITINEGIHANRNVVSYRFELFIAVIPKGTDYYMGLHMDIVSKKLIIFKTFEAYKRYKDNPNK